MSKQFILFITLILMLCFVIPVLAIDRNDDSRIGEADDSPVSNPIVVGERSTIDVIGEIRRFTGRFDSDDDEMLLEIINVEAGDIIYAYAAGIGRVDTYMYLLNDAQTDVFVEDNDSGGGYNAALSYRVEEAGNYIIGLITRNRPGRFQVVVGINTPEIINVIDQASSQDIVVDLEPFDCDDAEFTERPDLSGRERTHEEEDFIIHYTRTGSDATSEEWIEELTIALQLSLDTQLNELGWALPPADCGEGGDTRLDIYVMDIDFALGVASPENLVGDNPNTEVEEYYASYSYLMIENDIDFLEDEELALNQMRTTAAHEVHHNIQFGYDVNDRFFGFYEAGATWIETLVYPELTTAGADVTPVFNTPDACIGSFEGRGAGDFRIYGEWVMIDSFTRDLGIESYQFVWEYMAANEGLEGFYRALEELETTPQEVISRMAVRNLLRDYALGDFFETTVRIEATIEETGLISPRRNGVQQLSVDYVRVAEPGIYHLDLLEGQRLNMYLVGIDTDAERAEVYDIGNNGTVDTTQYDYAYIIVMNPDQHSYSDVCIYTDWLMQVKVGDEADIVEPTGEIWDASKFVVAE